MRLFLVCLPLLIAPLNPTPAQSQVVINEYVAANAFGIEDEDGDHEDWIELYNAGATGVELNGFALSDDVDEPFKWIFRRATMDSGSYLLIFASGKDRRMWAGHFETIIDHGDLWKYRVGVTEPPPDWRTIGFDDSTWAEGPSGFGYGDGDDATIIPATISVHIRKTFTVDDLSNVSVIVLHVDYDDGFVAYLNDVEIARANIGEPGDHPPYNQTTHTVHEAQMYQGFPPESFVVDVDPAALLQPGTNVLAIQAHNEAFISSDLSMIPFLTLGMVRPPPNPSGTPAILEFMLPKLHTNFKIDAAGEFLTLRDEFGQILELIHTGPMVSDVSRGRQPDGAPEWLFFAEPTPDTSNVTTGYPGFVPDPVFSLPSGFYSGVVAVTLTNPLPAAETYYTLDGADPTTESELYTAPVIIRSTKVLRARSFTPGLVPSSIQTRTYFLNEQITLPVVSLATDPPNLWDEDIGIYVLGRNASPDPPYFGANFWQDWERPIHVEYYEADGTPGFRLDAGVKIHGGYTRYYPQKSLRILARSAYGTPEIDYPVFEERENTRFKRLILRNAGSDWCRAMCRDAYMHRLAEDADIERMAYSPAIVFINGEYWGIHNIRERLDKHYLETYFGVDPEQVDILESNCAVVEGEATYYLQMLDFIENNDLSLEANYQVVQTMMETDNFAEYCIFEIYLNNNDWPVGNIKYWRPRTPEGRWRWLYFDLDAGLGLNEDYTYNLLEWATNPDGPGGEFPWANFLLFNLLKNDGFKHGFINRYADHLNTTFQPLAMQARLEGIRQILLPEVGRHYILWYRPLNNWFDHLDIISEFIDERPAFALSHILDKFELPGTLLLSLDVSPPASGSIRLTAISVAAAWSGTYFKTVPIPLTAIPAPGHVFAGWSDPELPNEPYVVVDPGSDYSVTAFFVPGGGDVVINEINYNSATNFDPEDWVEFVNSSPSHTIDISGWRFRDEDESHTFVFPPETVLEPGGYLVLCRDRVRFCALFPEVSNYLGDMDFGLSGSGEIVRLFDAAESLVDWVEYDDSPPWPPEPDGLGPTLELIDAGANNALPESWAASIAAHGTPGARNSVATGPAGIGAVTRVPRHLELQDPYPNPFNPTTTLVFGVPDRGPVRLSIYDATGRLVRRLVNRQLGPGWYRATWDGRNEQGRRVAAGIYFNELRGEGRVITGKLLLLR